MSTTYAEEERDMLEGIEDLDMRIQNIRWMPDGESIAKSLGIDKF